MATPNEKAPLGEGGRFAALAKKVKSKRLAAWIGRKKYGKKRFQALAVKGRKES
jgi:hypothetical protein